MLSRTIMEGYWTLQASKPSMNAFTNMPAQTWRQ